MRFTEREVLLQLDEAFKQYNFPMLKNTNIDFVSGRLHLFRNNESWSLIFNWIVWWPSVNGPHTLLYCCGNNVVGDVGFSNDKLLSPVKFTSNWDSATGEEKILSVSIRGQQLPHVEIIESEAAKMHPDKGFRVLVHLLKEYREDMLATKDEISKYLSGCPQEICVFDDWPHEAGGILPSQNETFINIAKILTQGNSVQLKTTAPPNTFWGNWIPK